jgi:predicted transcriptional regulator
VIRDDDDSVTVSTRLRPEDARRLAAAAIEDHTSRSRITRRALLRDLDERQTRNDA